MVKIALTLKLNIDDVVSIRDDGRPMFASKWHETLKPRVFSAYQKIVDDKRFDYRVGFAEDVIPKLRKMYELITDVYGAYFYSAGRVGLIEDYYNSLSENGEAFVVVYSEDRHIFSEPPRVVGYGPVSKMAGSEKSFEDDLIAHYPTIFSYSIVDERQGYVRSLHIRKDPNVNHLDLRTRFEIVEKHLDSHHDVEIMRQIPQITIRLR